MIKVIDSLAKFDSIKDIWEELEKNPQMRIQQTFEWNRLGWEFYDSKTPGTKLRILLWYQEERKEKVIFPFFIDKKNNLRFIMDEHSDILDAIYANNEELHYAFLEAADWIVNYKEIKRVKFRQMSGDSLLLNYFGVMLPVPIIYKDHAYSWLVTHKSEDFIGDQKQLKQKDRSRLRALNKKSQIYNFKILRKDTYNTFPINDIINLRNYLLKNTRRKITFFPDKLLNFAKELFNKGICEIPILSDENGVHALAFRLIKGNRINFWIFMYDDAKLPTELYVKYMIERAKESDKIFDFGAGVYRYKLQTFRPRVALTFSLLMAKSPWGQLMAVKDLLIRYVKDYLKPIIRKER